MKLEVEVEWIASMIKMSVKKIIKASEKEKIKVIEGIMKRTLIKTKERIAEVYTTINTKENWIIDRRNRSKRHMIKSKKPLIPTLNRLSDIPEEIEIR